MAKTMDELNEEMDRLAERVKDLTISVRRMRKETKELIERYIEEYDL